MAPARVLALAVGRGCWGPDCRLMTQSPRGWETGNCRDCTSAWLPAPALNTPYLRFLLSLEDTGEQTWAQQRNFPPIATASWPEPSAPPPLRCPFWAEGAACAQGG